jgi:L-threonylcarbamoyladenylate synthase
MSKERDEDIRKAVEVLRQGGTILYPTDTIWGIGCDATNPEAVRKVYGIKQREDSKALICLVDSPGRLQRYVRTVPDVAWDIIDLATKPTTIILNGASGLASNLLAEDGSVGLRVTSEVFSQQLCYRFQKAIVSTSANISGEPSPQTFADISDEIKNAVDYVCLSRQRDTSRHDPSSIIKLTPTGEVTIIRK